MNCKTEQLQYQRSCDHHPISDIRLNWTNIADLKNGNNISQGQFFRQKLKNVQHWKKKKNMDNKALVRKFKFLRKRFKLETHKAKKKFGFLPISDLVLVTISVVVIC